MHSRCSSLKFQNREKNVLADVSLLLWNCTLEIFVKIAWECRVCNKINEMLCIQIGNKYIPYGKTRNTYQASFKDFKSFASLKGNECVESLMRFVQIEDECYEFYECIDAKGMIENGTLRELLDFRLFFAPKVPFKYPEHERLSKHSRVSVCLSIPGILTISRISTVSRIL